METIVSPELKIAYCVTIGIILNKNFRVHLEPIPGTIPGMVTGIDLEISREYNN